ncbi:MAG: Aminotransferase class V [Thermotoga sp. 50_1627]|uniref:cysteine desulfurase n=1 Tax=Pseudothermotoga hypogea DSM 11164 = NBRC 106472 TaxID=1123384 RepID=A0A0X1KTE4_9THEM|nr:MULTISPECIES: cysteine desulfurase family protein [Pseudothermotoga]AJC74493.1 aminotransferase V [Pseudothermotoga hypogea DSM 11164 = NBRC 106472]KUK24284.1 MAG: Aminotransferase class V [Thermotoga sp. 50_1627]MDI6862370.1 cysteine desulfurase family protein [Pseudothermotoga sp.]
MKVFLDNCRTTRVLPEVIGEVEKYMLEKFARPDGLYESAQEIYDELTEARKFFAKTINANSDEEIIFTSGATEANNLALIGVARANKKRGNHIVVSALEHGSVMSIVDALKKEGFEVTVVPVDHEGMLRLEEFEKALRPTTILVSVIAVGHFVGSIMPLKQIGEILSRQDHKIYFHTDAAEMYAKMPLDVQDLKLDLVSVSGHKFHGPKGVGFLYVRKGTKIEPIMYGAESFDKRRPGGENVPAIMGMRKAAELAFEQMEESYRRLRELQDYFIGRIESEIEHVVLNGPRGEKRTPYNVNFSFSFIEGEAISLGLSLEGVEVATGSACASESLEPNYAILAIGGDHERAHGSIRFTFSRFTTKEELDYTVEKLKKVVQWLRNISPLKAER